VRVTVQQAPGFLQVEIKDDGRGFQMNQKGMPWRTTGLGLLGIRERTAIVGGTLEIESAPQRGTRIAVHIPVEESSLSGPLPVPSDRVIA